MRWPPPTDLALPIAAALLFAAPPERAMAADANAGPQPQTNAQAPARIAVSAGDKRVVYELNDSGAARALARQLPLTLKVEDYGGLEKFFYPPEKLSTDDTPLAETNRPGSLAY